MKRLLATMVGLALVVGAAGHAAGPHRALGSWTGRYTLGGEGELSLAVSGSRVFVALGAGHADLQEVPLTTTGGRLRFRLPGRPAGVVFDGAVVGGRLAGSVRQGSTRGSFAARPGSAPGLPARGLYRTHRRIEAVVDDPYGPARLVDLESGRVRALYPSGAGFVIGSGFASRSRPGGTARFGVVAARIGGEAARRVRVRQFEVRFRSGGATLAGTLSVPAGGGRHAAVAFVHGSGPTVRAYLPELSALLLVHGVAVLAYDKRGIGQSSGFYPGESPRPPRSTSWPATRRPPPAFSPRSRTSTRPESVSRATARPVGSRRSPRPASPRSDSSRSSPAPR